MDFRGPPDVLPQNQYLNQYLTGGGTVHAVPATKPPLILLILFQVT